MEVPARRDLILSAVGGSGETGHAGGDEQASMNGSDGMPASREVDATVSPLLIQEFPWLSNSLQPVTDGAMAESE